MASRRLGHSFRVKLPELRSLNGPRSHPMNCSASAEDGKEMASFCNAYADMSSAGGFVSFYFLCLVYFLFFFSVFTSCFCVFNDNRKIH